MKVILLSIILVGMIGLMVPSAFAEYQPTKLILIEKLEQLCSRPVSQIVNQRQEKLRRIGRFEQN